MTAIPPATCPDDGVVLVEYGAQGRMLCPSCRKNWQVQILGQEPVQRYCNQRGEAHDWLDESSHSGGMVKVCRRCGMATSYGRSAPAWETLETGVFVPEYDHDDNDRRAWQEEQRRRDAERAAAARLTEAAATIARTTGISMAEATRAMELLGRKISTTDIVAAFEPELRESPKPTARRVVLPED